MPVFMQTAGVRDLPSRAPTTLPQLVQQLRQRSGGYVLTSVARGAQDHRLQLVLQALRDQGVLPSPARLPLALESGLGFISIEARSGGAGVRAPLPALLVIAQAQAQALLIPAVQQVRDAARRMRLPAGTPIYIGGGAPTSAGPAFHYGQGTWFPLTRAGDEHEFEYDLVAAR